MRDSVPIMSLDGIRVVGLDLMGTLLYDPYREALLAATGRAPEELVALRTPGVWETFELGRIDEQTYAERFFTEESGLRFDLSAFRHATARPWASVSVATRTSAWTQGRGQVLASAPRGLMSPHGAEKTMPPCSVAQ